MPTENDAPVEGQFHNYTGNHIPWYVRVMWLGFWVLAVVYTDSVFVSRNPSGAIPAVTQASTNTRLNPTACAYCGLPTSSAAESRDPTFCCLGCQLAASISSEAVENDAEVSSAAMQLGLAIFFSMNVMVFTLALWSWDTYAISTTKNASILKELLRFGCLLFATPVLLILGRPLASNVISQLGRRLITADCLLIIGVVAAFGYSVFSVMARQEHIYFEVACMILLSVTLGRWLEAEGKQRAMKSLQSLQNLLPETARIVGPDGRLEVRPLAEVTIGETIRVLPGERIPLEGTIQSGRSYVDEKLVTGESAAACRSPGEAVFGGTVNLDGRLDIHVDANVDEGLIHRLVDAVRNAAISASRPQRSADRLATVFVPLVFLISVLVFLWHWHAAGIHAGMLASMAVALIACPCALAIATPLTIWAALGNAARHGVVFRRSDDLIALADVDTVCIDKTGTLTSDRPRLAGAWYLKDEERAVIAATTRLAAQTLHPLAGALETHFSDISANQDSTVSFEPAKTFPGQGVTAQFRFEADESPQTALLGSAKFCDEHGLQFSPNLRQRTNEATLGGQSIVCIGWGARVRGVFAFDESLRAGASDAVKALRALSLRTLLVTGDQLGRAQQVARSLDLDVAAQLLPGEKQQVVEQLQANGHKVAMIGDGLNDAPALSAADVGVALGCGAEITRDAADVCLLSSELTSLPWAVRLARVTQTTLRRNLTWAVTYNSIGIALAASGNLNPILAALAMVFSSGFVIAESLRLSVMPGPATSTKRLQIDIDNDPGDVSFSTADNEALAMGVISL